MKKIIGWTIVVCITLLIAGLGTYVLIEMNNTKATQQEKLNGGNDEKIGGVQNTTHLKKGDDEEKVVSVMHKMTHQKVAADEKWGAVPMTPSTIKEVISIVEKEDYKEKKPLLDILQKWQAGNFTEVDQDHNYLWTLQDGTEGKAYGIMSPIQERQFVHQNFNDTVAKELGYL
ncbi:DUF6241 domain-containing protein [Domibacillus sp. 8LH]|uniref:DUF6241 domain-containing protein n=1 Tax=Domibacillus sp. 8LH TaxID=3073900 RepID=UPI0031759D34